MHGRVTGLEQPSGTYVWMVQVVDRNGKAITKKGTVTLIRYNTPPLKGLRNIILIVKYLWKEKTYPR